MEKSKPRTEYTRREESPKCNNQNFYLRETVKEDGDKGKSNIQKY
jgi:hypothetical protein